MFQNLFRQWLLTRMAFNLFNPAKEKAESFKGGTSAFLVLQRNVTAKVMK